MNKGAFQAGMAGLLALATGLGIGTAKPWEGRVNTSYLDPIGILSVCDGHTGKDIVIGKVYSDAECDAMTEADMKRELEPVLTCSPHLTAHPIQLAAVASFSYNVGGNTYCRSSIRTAFDKGDWEAGCDAMGKYIYAGGRVLPGLRLRRYGDARRIGEIELCKASLTPQRWWAFRVKAGLV